MLLGTLAATSAGAQTPPAQSFEQLRTTLSVGKNLIIRDADGRKITGRLSSLTDSQIEVESRRWIRSRKQTFNESAVRRIQIRDNAWNGTLLGLGIGAAGSLVICSVDDSQESCLASAVLGPLVGVNLGALVDVLNNRTVYQAPGRTTTTLSPVIGPGRLGLAARARF
jgi:hypothetical protein